MRNEKGNLELFSLVENEVNVLPWRDGVVPTAADSGADGAIGTYPPR